MMIIKFATIDLKSIVFFAMLMLCSFTAISAQTMPNNPVPLNAKTQKIKDEITKIGRWGEITIIDKDSKEFYGSVLAVNENSVQIHDVDLKADVEIKYERIKKIRKGYGDDKNVYGKRIPNKTRFWGFIIGVGVAVVLPIVLVANMKD